MSESLHGVCPACDAVNRIPTLAVFKGEHEVARPAGAMDMNDIIRWVRSQI